MVYNLCNPMYEILLMECVVWISPDFPPRMFFYQFYRTGRKQDRLVRMFSKNIWKSSYNVTWHATIPTTPV